MASLPGHRARPACPCPDNGPLDLEAARALGLGVLVDKARNGSVSAAASVFKTASAELRADRCKDHIPTEDVVKALQAQYGLWRMHFKALSSVGYYWN